jgi:3-oxoacyl-[acyl-carrier-protein] synthase-1
MMTPRKVAVVGIGGAFPTCKNVDEFGKKLFAGKSLVREWPEALQHGKKLRSTVSGYVSVEESGLEEVMSSILDIYPDIYLDKLQRLSVENLSTADLGSIWSMLGTLDAIKMSGWSDR